MLLCVNHSFACSSEEDLLRIARVEQGVTEGVDQLLVLDDAVLVARLVAATVLVALGGGIIQH